MNARTAIFTKVIPATGKRPTRIKATAGSTLSVTISYPMEPNDQQDCHRIAAQALLDKMQWKVGGLIPGALPDGGYVWIQGGEISEVLDAAVAALNTAPRFKVPSKACDSYDIAAKLERIRYVIAGDYKTAYSIH